MAFHYRHTQTGLLDDFRHPKKRIKVGFEKRLQEQCARG